MGNEYNDAGTDWDFFTILNCFGAEQWRVWVLASLLKALLELKGYF